MNKDELVSWIDIFVTERCNLDCKYCFHSQTPRDMSDETMEATLDFFDGKITEDCIINLFGGEPFLREDFCYKWIHKIRERFPNVRFSMSTNGVKFADLLMDDLKKPYMDLQISYDGVCQDMYRGQNDIVVENIKRYASELTKDDFHLRLTFTNETVGTLYESVKLMHSLGARRMSHQAVIEDTWKPEDFKVYKEQLLKIYDYTDKNPDAQVYFCQCDRVTNTKNSICSMGKGLVAVDAEGDLYPCHRAIKFPEFRMGSVHDEVLNRGRFYSMVIPGCNNCFAQPTCHPCVIANYEMGGSLFDNPPATCEINKIEFNEAYKRFTAENKELFELQNLLIPMEKVLIDTKEDRETVLKALRRIKDGSRS